VGIYPYVHTAWEAAILSYQTAYLFGKSRYHSPFVQLAGVELVNDLEIGDEHEAVLPDWNGLRYLMMGGYVCWRYHNSDMD